MVSGDFNLDSHRLKLDPVMKKSLQANRRNQTLVGDFSQLSITESKESGHERRARAAAFEEYVQKKPSEFVRELNSRLESILVKSGSEITYDESDNAPLVPLSHLEHYQISSPNELKLEAGVSNEIKPGKANNKIVLEPTFHHYQPTFKSKEVSQLMNRLDEH